MSCVYVYKPNNGCSPPGWRIQLATHSYIHPSKSLSEGAGGELNRIENSREQRNPDQDGGHGLKIINSNCKKRTALF